MIATRREFAGLAAFASVAATSVNACEFADPPAGLTDQKWQKQLSFIAKYPDMPASKAYAQRFISAVSAGTAKSLVSFFGRDATVAANGENVSWQQWRTKRLFRGDWKMISSFNGGQTLCIRASQTDDTGCGPAKSYWLLALTLDQRSSADGVRISSMEAIRT